MTYKKAKKICREAGLFIHDGLAFTVCNGRLVNGDQCPEWLLLFNGSCVFEAGRAIKRRIKNDVFFKKQH